MILNGRTNGDYWGNFTHYNKNKGASTVDLAIISGKTFENVKSFRVLPQQDISDHCKIVTQIDNINQTFSIKPEEQETYNWLKLPNKYKWEENQVDKYKKVLDSDEIKMLISQAEQTLEAGLIESTGSKIQDIFIQAADICLNVSNPKIKEVVNKNNNIKKKKINKKFYDGECRNIKNRVKVAANIKHQNPHNINYRQEHKEILKKYKNICRYKQIEFRKKEKEKIDNANSNFWDIWKNLGEERKQEHNINANGKEWENYFSNLYKKQEESTNDKLENINIIGSNNVLIKPFTMNELKKTIENLKKNKATGYDNISNEFLKLSTERILKLLLSFLNLTLTKGMITSKWCLDIITPIHKAGTKSNPDNYRGICVMNSLLKVLCTIMNNRLVEYAEISNLINHGK